MQELRCDMIVKPITSVENEDEVKYSVPLAGKTTDGIEVKLVVKTTDRTDLINHGIDMVGNHKTVILTQKDSQLTDFE